MRGDTILASVLSRWKIIRRNVCIAVRITTMWGYGDIEAIWANLTHPNRNQRNIIVLLLIRRVDLHITDDGIHHLFYRHLSWDIG